MMAFPVMLVEAAEKAGIKVPPNPDKFDSTEFPHFAVYCNVQLCRRIRWGEHWGNAEVIAAVPNDKIMTVTLTDLLDMGLEFSS